MGIISRFTDIMSANVNALLEKAEQKNADKLLEKYLRDAKENLDEVKAETAAIIADEMAAGRRVTSLEEEITKLSMYAEQAVVAGNDSDALKFLEGKNKAAEQKIEAEKAYAIAQQNSDKMRQLTKKLLNDVGEAEGKLNELKGKLAVAAQSEKMNDLNEKISSAAGGFSDYDRLADAVQKRIDAADAKADLNKTLNENYDMDTLMDKYDVAGVAATTSANDDLAALKAKLKK